MSFQSAAALLYASAVRRCRTNLVRCISEWPVPVFDKFAKGIATDCTDVGRRPPRQIDHESLSTRWLTASYREASAERSDNGQMHFITAIQRNRHQKKSMSRSAPCQAHE